jgi:acyl carrier protein
MHEPHGTIVDVIRSVAGSRGPRDFSPTESLFDAGILDSFSLLELVSALEAAFDVKIPGADLNARTFDTVDKIADCLQRNHR